jgi:hypothetical protein
MGECIQDVVSAHNNVAQQTNASPVGITPAPTPHAGLSVTGGNGYFSASITDPDPSFRGKEHFLVAIDPSSGNQHMIHLGAATTWYGYLGKRTLHFASYPQYPTSGPATPIYRKNINGAALVDPPLPASANALNGWGTQPYTTTTVPKR